MAEHPLRAFSLTFLLLVALLLLGPRGLIPRTNAEALALGETGAHSESDLAAAFAAAFGPGDYALRRLGKDRELIRFTPNLLIEAPFGPVLISEGRVLSPSAASTGNLAIVYLERRANGYRPRLSFIPAAEAGSLGELDGWRIRADLGPYPVVEVQADCGLKLELAPGGPRRLAMNGTDLQSMC